MSSAVFQKSPIRLPKIGILCLPSMGGSSRAAIDLAVALNMRGHLVELISSQTPFFCQPQAPGLKLHVIPAAPFNSASHSLDVEWSKRSIERFGDSLIQLLARSGIEIVHFHYAMPFALVASYVAAKLGASAPIFVGTLHGTDVTRFGNHPMLSRPLGRAIQRLHWVTTVSQSHAALSKSTFKLHKAPTVVPNFINPGRGCRPPEPVEFLPRRKFELIHSSNFRSVKQSQRAAKLFLAIRCRLPATLTLVGDGVEMAQVRALLEDSPYRKDVNYKGMVCDGEKCFAGKDLCLITSKYESFSLVALEAISNGVPVIGPKTGGLPEVVSDGQCGHLYPPDDWRQAVEMAISLLSDQENLLQKKWNAWVDSHRFSLTRVIDKYERVYLDAVARLNLRSQVRLYGNSRS